MLSTRRGFNSHDITNSSHSTVVTCVAYVGSSVYRVSSSGRTSPRCIRRYPSGDTKCSEHAEMAIVNKLPKGVNPRRVKLLVLRKSRGRFSNSKPCAFCQRILSEYGIKPRHVTYYDWNGQERKLRSWDFKTLKEEYPNAV